MLYTVYVRDRLTKAEVCVGDMLSHSEAMRLKRYLEEFDNDIVIVAFEMKKGRFFFK